MLQYNKRNFKPCNSQIQKLKAAEKDGSLNNFETITKCIFFSFVFLK